MWKSTLSKDTLVARARLLSDIRCFFADRGVLEVDVPVLGATTVTDVHLSALSVSVGNEKYYLQTSPEFFMKRLLAGGAGAIYSLGKSFRNDQVSKRHNPEFTMLEWYREGFTDRELIDEVVALITFLKPGEAADMFSYGAIFERYVGVNPHLATVEELALIAAKELNVVWQDDDKSTWLDVLFSHKVEPNLQKLTVIYDYPACQCALARVGSDDSGLAVAKRFELFWHGIELANGYWELTDAQEQLRRFERDILTRRKRGLAEPKIDAKFMSALSSGLPECAGVALGVDRLFMCLQEEYDIGKTIPFAFEYL